MQVGLVELGEILLTRAERRLEVTANNVANATTPGFKRSISFSHVLRQSTVNTPSTTALNIATVDSQGSLTSTGRPFDLAISGEGSFLLRTPDGPQLTRNGRFERAPNGHLINASGHALQGANGEDIVLGAGEAEIFESGVVLQNGLPIAKIGVFAHSADPPRVDGATSSSFANRANSHQPESLLVEGALIRRGMIETANVDSAAEALATMSIMREAEVGARILQTYDALIGQSISTLGRSRK